jgi:glycosyltransferase involved in cell wall biosynthesis
MSDRPIVILLPYLSCSGLELFGLRFAQDLLARGIPAVVAAPDDSLIAGQCYDRKIPRWEFPETKKYEPWSFPACSKMFLELEPRAVIAFRTQMMYPIHYARLRTGKHVPFFLFYRIGAGNYYRNDPIHRRLFRYLSAVVPNADHVKNKICKYWAIDSEKVVCIKSGVDTRRYRPDPALRSSLRKEIGIGEGDFLIGSTGRIHPEKGSEILLRALFASDGAAAGRKDVHLLYVGREYEPGYIDHLNSVAAQLGVAQQFHIIPFRNDIETVYSALDLFAFAVTSHETYAYVTLEAMASGVVPVVPHIGGMKEMYTDGVEGWFFEHRNTESLKKVLTKALTSSKKELVAMGGLARQRIVEKASWKAMMETYLDLFRRCGVDQV